MDTKILVIGVVKKGNSILLRKKPEGAGNYKETWYLIGGMLESNSDPKKVIVDAVKQQTGITVEFEKELGWDTEIKPDPNGEETFFVYLDSLCEYVSGDLSPAPGIEKL